MKITKIVIYGFGKHEDLTIHFHDGINVLYGHNESGKTTIQQFILHVLFGFPHRNSNYLRYEPKAGGKYGGQVHLYDSQYGKCIVERVRGKAVGDVKVYFEDGKIGDEQSLTTLLRQYDRTSFESIFSFSLLQLQAFEKMNEEQLSQTLLASGTTGVDHLLKIELKMNKQLEELFKKQGRVPELNKKAAHLRKLEESLLHERKKADSYAPAMTRINDIEERLKSIAKEKKKLDLRFRELTYFQQQYPLYQKKQQLMEQLKILPNASFPTDGIQRYETIAYKMEEVKASIIHLTKEIEKLKEFQEESSLHEKRIAIDQMIERETAWHRSLSQIDSFKDEKYELKNQIDDLRTRLGIQMTEEVEGLKEVNLSIREEERMYELLHTIQQLHQEIDRIHDKLATLENEWALLEAEEEKESELSEADIRAAKEWPAIEKKLAEARAYVNMAQQQSSLPIYLLLFASLLIAIYGILTKQYMLLIIPILLTAIALFNLKKQKGQSILREKKQFIAIYEKEEEQMEKMLERLRQFEHRAASYKDKKFAIETGRKDLETLLIEKEKALVAEEQLLEQFLSTYGIDGLPSPHLIPELFRMMRDIQEFLRRIDFVSENIIKIEGQIASQLTESEQLLQEKIPFHAHFEWLRKERQAIVDQIQHHRQVAEKKVQLKEQLQEKETLFELLRQQIAQLFEEANVQNVESYYEANQRGIERREIEGQIEQLQMQLGRMISLNKTFHKAEIEQELQEIEERLQEMNEEQHTLLEEKAILVNETKALLTDEKYSELQQAFELERASFNTIAKKWARKKALAVAIREMMTHLQDEVFPEVLQYAEKLFSELTSGRYERVVVTEEGNFEVVNRSGVHFPIIELSQATKEQIYLSLRLALARSLKETAPFPIIMDDPFVHFDVERLSHIINIVEKLHDHQFIYFTCHEKMKHVWKKAKTMNVSSIANDKGASAYETTTGL